MKIMAFAGLMLIQLSLVAVTRAELVTKEINYSRDSVDFKGFLVYDGSSTAKRPGILLVHEWWGLNDYAKRRSQDLAREGYIVLAADMYGQGKNTTDPKVAGQWAPELKEKGLLASRAQAGLETLAKSPLTDSTKLGAIGFCFGGTTVLDLAWSGASVKGVASFHGGLTWPKPDQLKAVKASILVLHGADDSFTSEKDITDFQASMRQGKLDWLMVSYGNAVHSFTNPDSSKLGMPGIGYEPRAAERSWRQMLDFFKELFSSK